MSITLSTIYRELGLIILRSQGLELPSTAGLVFENVCTCEGCLLSILAAIMVYIFGNFTLTKIQKWIFFSQNHLIFAYHWCFFILHLGRVLFHNLSWTASTFAHAL